MYDINTLREITIKFYDPDYHQTLIDWFKAGDESRLAATLEMEGVVYDSVAIRYKGNITFTITESAGLPKFPLNIDMNEHINNQTLLGYKKLKLGNLYTDPTAVREAIAYGIYRKYTVAPKSNLIKVNIGVVGEEATYFGVYSNSESINKDYLKKHYDWKKGPLIKCDPNPIAADITCDNSGLGNGAGGEQIEPLPDLVWYGPDSCQYYSNYEIKTDFGWKEFVEFIDILNNKDSLLYDHLNIDGVLWHMAVSTVIPNIDTYYGQFIHNYYMYKHKDSLWHVLPWDANETLGGVLGNQAVNYDVLKWFEPNQPNRPLVWQLLKHDRYFKQYFAHIRTVMEENYSEENISSQVNSLQDLIEQAVVSGPYERFPDEDFRKNVEYDIDYDIAYPDIFALPFYKGIIPTVNERLAYLNNHPEINKIPPTLKNTSRNIEEPEEGQDVWVTAEVANTTQVDLMISTEKAYASYFEPFEMKDDGLNNDGVANDGIYGALVPFQAIDEEIKYYVRAQNDDAMILEPRRAEFEFFDYKIKPIEISSSITNNSEIGSLFNIYPNPANNYLTIDGDLEIVKSIKVYNLTGQLVYQKFNPISSRMSLEDLPNGLYTICFSTNETVDLKKLVINK